MISAGIFGGLAIGVSAWYQGVIGAAASDAQAETGKGFGNYLMALGIIETVAAVRHGVHHRRHQAAGAITEPDMDLQSLFAERIGGARFGLVERDLQVREDQAREGRGARRRGRTSNCSISAWASRTRWRPAPIREALKKAVDDPANRGYADNGIREFKVAAARIHARVLRRARTSTRTRRSTTASARSRRWRMLPLCFINPGDVALVTVPGYPVLATHTRYLGGEVVKVPLLHGERVLSRT